MDRYFELITSGDLRSNPTGFGPQRSGTSHKHTVKSRCVPARVWHPLINDSYRAGMYRDQVDCLRWLGLDEATENVRLIQNDKGFGMEAVKDLKKGTVIAAIGNSNIITYQKALQSQLGQAICATDAVTKEMLLWYLLPHTFIHICLLISFCSLGTTCAKRL